MAYFVENNIILKYNVSEDTIKSGCLRYRQGKSSNWINKPDNIDKRKILIDLDSIPERTRLKYGIPTGAEYLEQQNQLLAEQLQKEKAIQSDKELKMLYDAYHSGYYDYVAYYQEVFQNKRPKIREEQSVLHARSLAYWLTMVKISGGKWRGMNMQRTFQHHLTLSKDLQLVNNINSYVRFTVFLKDLRIALQNEQGIEDCVINGHRFKVYDIPNNLKTTDFHKMVATSALCHEKRYSYRIVADIVNHHARLEGLPTISESWVKWMMRENIAFRNLIEAKRLGLKDFNNNMLPHINRYKTPYPGDVWMIDGTPLQFYCKDEHSGRLVRLNLFVILDVCTRKVVGFDIAYTENKESILKAFKNAITLTGHLPAEVVSDNFSANKTEELKKLQAFAQSAGMGWRHAMPGNAQDKSYVERFFGSFQTMVCALYDDYIGEGIMSKRNIMRPSKEFLMQYVKKNGYVGKNQMVKRIISMVARYNATERPTIPVPNETYKTLPKPHTTKVDDVIFSRLFWTETEHTVRRGMVKFKINYDYQNFEIYEHDLKLRLQGQKVRVRYNPENLEEIFLFEYETDEFLTRCKPSITVHLGAVHQTEEDIKKMQKHAAKKKSYISYIDREIEAINQKGLAYIGKESYDIISPVEIGKEKLNTKESMDLMAYYYGVYNTPVDIVEEAKEQKTKTIATIGKTTSVEDIIVNKSNTIHSQKIGAVVSQPPQ